MGARDPEKRNIAIFLKSGSQYFPPITLTNKNQLSQLSNVSGMAYKNDHCQGRSQRGAQSTALRYTPSKTLGPHQYAITNPNAVGKYHNDAPGPTLNQRESHVPRLAIKNGKTHVHQGREAGVVCCFTAMDVDVFVCKAIFILISAAIGSDNYKL